jgi:glycine/D-amino acid oxidase-like deaminating enzyme
MPMDGSILIGGKVEKYHFVVIGGGVIGSAIAYGLAKHSSNVGLMDEGDVAFRAARGNFGLVWFQGKGHNMPFYSHWTRRAIGLWPRFATELKEETGIDISYKQSGGLHVCFDEKSFAERKALLKKMAQESLKEGPVYDFVEGKDLAELMPGAHPEIAGASYCPIDGTCNPLKLLQALISGFQKRGGRFQPRKKVVAIKRQDGCYKLTLEDNTTIITERLVLAAGLGTKKLAKLLGLECSIYSQRGQILVTEKVEPTMPIPADHLRQCNEGTFLCGASHENVGDDEGTDLRVTSRIANDAVSTIPSLKKIKVIRSWGSLRILTPDGAPIYEAFPQAPGVYMAIGHSGVTMAAIHAKELAKHFVDGVLPRALSVMEEGRFHVQKA